MLKKTLAFMLIGLTLTGCAGRSAHPVTVRQTGDEGKSCQTLQSELVQIENNIQRLIPETDKSGKNIALGVTGLIVWPAWLFMDLSSAEKEEVNAFRARHDHLITIANSKQCSVANQTA